MNIGIKLKALRKKRGLTIDQLSKLSGVTPVSINNIELGKAKPTLNTICKICIALEQKSIKIEFQ